MKDRPFPRCRPLRALAVNLFHGYGYNFYRIGNQLRADHQRVRSLAGAALNQARAAIDRAGSGYRRERIPPPTRASPLPDPAGDSWAQAPEWLARAIGAIEGRVRSPPVPKSDRMT